jgi:cyclase
MYDALTKGGASAALIASIVHYGEYTIPDLKKQIQAMGCKMRLTW